MLHRNVSTLMVLDGCFFGGVCFFGIFFFPLRFECLNEVEEFLCLSCECCQDDSETSLFSVFAVLNFDTRCSVGSTELDDVLSVEVLCSKARECFVPGILEMTRL